MRFSFVLIMKIRCIRIKKQAIAKLGKDMIEDGSYSIIYEDVAHACYTKLVIDTNPEIKAYVLAPLAVLPEFQRKGYATRLMDKAENELDADVIFVMGHPKHYSRRYNTAHKVETPLPTDKSEHWFAKELVPGILSGVVSSSSLEGPYSDPSQWFEPEKYKAESMKAESKLK